MAETDLRLVDERDAVVVVDEVIGEWLVRLEPAALAASRALYAKSAFSVPRSWANSGMLA